jgi:phosphopantothenoylcysteine decarboxylase
VSWPQKVVKRLVQTKSQLPTRQIQIFQTSRTRDNVAQLSSNPCIKCINHQPSGNPSFIIIAADMSSSMSTICSSTAITPSTIPLSTHKPHILVLATGSVATIKLPLLLAQLLQHTPHVRAILTPSAMHFIDGLELPPSVTIYTDDDEWAWRSRVDLVLHIELRRWADLLLIAPLSANSLGAIASGLCPGLGLSVVRAWDTEGIVEGLEGARRRKMIFVAPAMNTQMWIHPLTATQLRLLKSWGWFRVLYPVSKILACGDTGVGGMMEVAGIVKHVIGYLSGEEREEVEAENQ